MFLARGFSIAAGAVISSNLFIDGLESGNIIRPQKVLLFFCRTTLTRIIHMWLVCISWLTAILNGKEHSTGQCEVLGSYFETEKSKNPFDSCYFS